MSLIDNWKEVLTKAWSVRLIAVAAVLSGAEAILPMYVDRFPHDLFTLLSGLVTSAALLSRFIAQKSITPTTTTTTTTTTAATTETTNG